VASQVFPSTFRLRRTASGTTPTTWSSSNKRQTLLATSVALQQVTQPLLLLGSGLLQALKGPLLGLLCLLLLHRPYKIHWRA
jgi:hypothetical protein